MASSAKCLYKSPFNQLMSQVSAPEVSGQRFKWNGQETLSQDDPEMWNLLQQEKQRQVFSLKESTPEQEQV